MKKLHAFAAGLLLALSAHAATFNQFGPSTGVLKGSATSPQTSAATSSDIRAMWSGVCSSSTYLRGDGTCAAAVPATAALTKTDDTNVTATLGGSPSTALLNAASITLGWTGNLAVSRGGTGAGTLTGPLKGNGTSAFTAATAADMYALWSGTCNSSSFLRGDGACAAPSSGYATTALETAASVTPTGTSFPPGDPRRAPAFYPSAGWTDYGGTPAYVDATHYTYSGDWTAYAVPFARLLIIGASGSANVRVVSSSYSAPNTTIVIANDVGDALPTSPLAIWIQTGLIGNGFTTNTFNKNAIGGFGVVNRSTGTLSAARYSAWTTDSSGVANSAISMVAVSPNYSGAYLSGGFTSGGRSVIYTPPSYHFELGTSDIARLKIDSGGLFEMKQPTTASPTLIVNGPASGFPLSRFVGNGSNNQFLEITNGSGVAAGLALRGNNTTFATDDFSIFQNGDGRAFLNNRGNFDMVLMVNATTALTIDNDTGIYTTTATGSSQGAGTINATGFFVNGVSLAGGATTSGTFSPTFTGFSSAPSCTMKWRLTGSTVSLFVDAAGTCTGTSNATTMTITNLPTAIRPSNNAGVNGLCTDNGADNLCLVVAQSSGTATFYKFATTFSSTGFTASGTKGVTAGVYIYDLRN